GKVSGYQAAYSASLAQRAKASHGQRLYQEPG
ncbi:unnamed protein product, partial [marine sediment metagenome]